MYVVGTSGHVDHGKSSLVKALTGIDPDRLIEEKQRGMTIDLGFAWLRLPSGKEISIVDVPGHQQFIENMLAGVGAIDAVILVVAANDGVMPQTREHLDILDLLQISNGVIALTKIDLVEPDLRDLAVEEVRTLVDSTSLRGAAILPLSTITGEGLDAFVVALDRALEATPRRPDLQRPRLWIDRVFTRPGFGTVVTGTLIDGPLQVGQEVVILPQGAASRIRNMESHKRRIEHALPGTRVAVNLSGLAVTDLRRGNVLTIPERWQPTKRLDVRLHCLTDVDEALPDGVTGRFFIGSLDCGVKVRLLDRDLLLPGETTCAQLFLDTPVTAARGDRFIIRRPAQRTTAGGGLVLDPHPLRHNRMDAAVLENLVVMERGRPEEIVRCVLGQKMPLPISRLLEWTGLSPIDLEAAIQHLLAAGEAILLGVDTPNLLHTTYLVSQDRWRWLLQELQDLLAAYHHQFPLRSAMPKEECRTRLELTDDLFRLALQRACDGGRVKDQGTGISLAGFAVRFTVQQQKQVDDLLRAHRLSPYAPPVGNEALKTYGLAPELFQALLVRGDLVGVGDDVYFLSDIYQEMIDRIVAYLQEHGSISIAQARDLFDTSRRYILALMEHLDRKITRRVGDERVLRATYSD